MEKDFDIRYNITHVEMVQAINNIIYSSNDSDKENPFIDINMWTVGYKDIIKSLAI